MKELLTRVAGNPGKIAPLDGLRAFAIIFVVCRHGLISFRENFSYEFNGDSFISNFLLNGWLGVDLFFVLSGFLIGYHLLNSWPEGKGRRIAFFGSYWLKRVLRTFPVYYFVILLILFELVPLYQHTSVDIESELFIHVTFLQDYYGSNFLVPMWSLATEEKFYLLCPLLLWAIYRFLDSPFVLYFSLILLSALPLIGRLNTLSMRNSSDYVDFFWTVRSPFHMALDGLLMGLIVSLVIYRAPNKPVLGRWSNHAFVSVVMCSIVLMGIFEWLSGELSWYLASVMIFLFSALFALIVLFSINCTGRIKIFLSSVALRFFSKISYSLYLVHMLMIPMSVYICKQLIDVNHLSIFEGMVYFGIYVLLSILFALFVHFLVERPFLHLKSKVKY